MLAREHDRVTLVAQPVPGPDFRLVQHVYATTYLLWYVVAVKARLSARKVLRTALAADPVTSLELTHSSNDVMPCGFHDVMPCGRICRDARREIERYSRRSVIA